MGQWHYIPSSTPPFTDTYSMLVAAASSQYVAMGNNIAFDRTDPFTLSIWIKPNTLTGAMMSKLKIGAPYTGYSLGLDPTGSLRWQFINAFGSNYLQLMSAPNIVTGSWQHVAVTSNGGTAATTSLYINGVAQSISTVSDTLSASALTTDGFNISNDNNSGFFDGHLDEASTWNTNLTALQVAEIYNSGTPNDLSTTSMALNLTHWWRLGDPPDNSTTTFDQAGANNGTLTNGPTYTTDVP